MRGVPAMWVTVYIQLLLYTRAELGCAAAGSFSRVRPPSVGYRRRRGSRQGIPSRPVRVRAPTVLHNIIIMPRPEDKVRRPAECKTRDISHRTDRPRAAFQVDRSCAAAEPVERTRTRIFARRRRRYSSSSDKCSAQLKREVSVILL